MVAQVTECGGIAVLAREEVLVNAQNLWAHRVSALGIQAPQEVLAIALDGGTADVFASGHAAAVHTVPVVAEHFLPKRFAGPLPRQHSGKAFPKLLAAAIALPAMAVQPQPNPAYRPTDMAQQAFYPALITQPLALAARA